MPTQLNSQPSMNFKKGLWCRFQQSLGTFTMLLVEGSSETALFRHLSNHVFGVCNVGNTKAARVIFFESKHSKFNLNFKNAARNWENAIRFSDNYIWISIVKFSLLRTGYFTLVANVLTSSPKNWHVNKREFLEHNFHASDEWIW